MAITTGTPEWEEIFNDVQKAASEDTAVAMPGNVVSYANGVATVRVGVRRLVPAEDNEYEDVPEELPVIPGVRVMWPAGRGFEIRGTLLPGDPVLLLVCDRDISAWLRSGSVSDPEDSRVHSWGGGVVAIPGLRYDGASFAPTPPATWDSAALASRLDALIGLLKSTPETGTGAIATALVLAFPDIPSVVPEPATDVTTTGSTVLKLAS
jgi:hypothetical protein